MSRAARFVATWGGCGLSPVAPGTVGSIGALPLYFAVRGAGAPGILATAAIVTLAGVWAAGVYARETGLHDPQKVVVDEAAGTLLALAAAPPSLSGVVTGVALFRLFDITKPFPARRAERLPGGWGIMMDDVVAGLQAVLVLLALRAGGVLS